MSYEYLYRIVILGDSCAGKTSFMNKYISNKKEFNNLPTIGVDFNAKIMNGPENKKVKVHFWDTSGNKNFRSIARSYFGGVAGAIMLYNMDCRDTFTNLTEWLDDFRLTNRYTEIPIILLGANFGCERVVSREEGEYYAKTNNLLYDEVDFTNDIPIYTNEIDILQPLWDTIWNTFIKEGNICYGIKKVNMHRDEVSLSPTTIQEPHLSLLYKIKEHIVNLKTGSCIIS